MSHSSHYSTEGYPSLPSPSQPAPSTSSCCFSFFPHISLLLTLSPPSLCFSTVSVVLKERRSKDSVTLAWQGPERPNGAIVEYEVIYYEKVRKTRAQTRSHLKRHTTNFTHDDLSWSKLKRKPALQSCVDMGVYQAGKGEGKRCCHFGLWDV